MTDAWRIHTLVFDLDDTLFAEEEFVQSGFRAAGDWLLNGRGINGFAAEATRRFQAGERATIFDATLASLGVPDNRDLVDALIEIYRNHRPTISLLPDARAVLEWATGQFALALITDGYQNTQKR